MMLPPAVPNCLTASCVVRIKTENIQIEMLMEVLFGDLFKWRKFENAGVVNKDVDSGERFLCFGEEAVNVLFLRHIGLHGNCFAAFRRYFRYNLVLTSRARSVVD